MTDTSGFFDMGGYAAYIWPAYGISIVAITVLCVISWRWMRRVERIVAAGGGPSSDT